MTRSHRRARTRSVWGRLVPCLLPIFVLALVLVGCAGPEPTPQIVVVTATFTPEPVVVVVTATFTPTSKVVPSNTPLPTETLVPATSTPVATETVSPAETPTIAPPTPTQPQPTPTHTVQPVSDKKVKKLPTVGETATEPASAQPPQPSATPAPIGPKATDGLPQLTPTSELVSKAPSLDSYRVIYSEFAGGDETDEYKYSVWTMRGDGKGAAKLLEPAIEPAFSPSGKKIAYYRPFNGIWIHDLAAKSAQHVVVSDYAEFASFAPNGNRLVFHEWIGGFWSAEVYILVSDLDGSNRSQIVQGIRPAWSPKGDLIAFDSCRDNNCGVFVIQPNGQGLRQLTSDSGGKVAWSPDGKRIAYSTEKDGDPEIWLVNADGTQARQLTNNKGNDTLPAFSPDGEYIFYLSDQNGKAWAIRAMKADGSEVKTIRTVGVPPRWQFSRLWVGSR